MMALSDTEIKKAKLAATPYKLSDGGGLYLLVQPTGGKLFRWAYRFDGKQKTMTFGRYPDVSLLNARDRHRDARKLLATGIDPMAERMAVKAAKRAAKVAEETASGNMFRSVASLWLVHWANNKSPRHVDSVRRRMEADIFPCLGDRPIDEIEAPELVAMAKKIEERDARDIAKRDLQTSGQVFRYAIAHGYAKRNPVTDIKPADVLKPTVKVNYARIDGKELAGLLRAIEVYRGTHITRLAMKLMALTFVRTGELIGARWEEFDLENARWDIPAARMKMKTPHIVPLARQTLELLEMLRPLSGNSEWLFPGDRNPAKHLSNNTLLKALERMGYKGKMTGHGFRGLASTLLHERGYLHEHIELQLAHSPRNSVSAAYNHALYLEPRAKMMSDWADYLELTQRGVKLMPIRGRSA